MTSNPGSKEIYKNLVDEIWETNAAIESWAYLEIDEINGGEVDATWAHIAVAKSILKSLKGIEEILGIEY